MNAAALFTRLRRGIAAEAARTAGTGFLWRIALPLAFALPLLITAGIAAVAEEFAAIPGQNGFTPTTTANAAYWVITFTTSIMMVTAAYAHGTQGRGDLHDLEVFLFPRAWIAALARWLFYGTLAALSSVILLAVVLTALPHLFPHVYGSVSLTDPVGIRFLWAVPVYAFAACGIGIAAATAIRVPSAAVAVLLFWVYVAENAISLLPHGYSLQEYAPFLNAVYATGQQLAFVSHFGPNGSLTYFLLIAAVAFILSQTAGQRARHVA